MFNTKYTCARAEKKAQRYILCHMCGDLKNRICKERRGDKMQVRTDKNISQQWKTWPVVVEQENEQWWHSTAQNTKSKWKLIPLRQTWRANSHIYKWIYRWMNAKRVTTKESFFFFFYLKTFMNILTCCWDLGVFNTEMPPSNIFQRTISSACMLNILYYWFHTLTIPFPRGWKSILLKINHLEYKIHHNEHNSSFLL